MKPLTIEKTVKKIGEQGLLPMFSQEKQSVAEQILEAAYAGGARALEFTNRTGRALEVFKYLRKRTRRDMPDLLLGAGTILDEEQAERFLEAGADFIVSPIVDKTVAKACAKAKRMWCPGRQPDRNGPGTAYGRWPGQGIPCPTAGRTRFYPGRASSLPFASPDGDRRNSRG
jgi:hypothetical protein